MKRILSLTALFVLASASWSHAAAQDFSWRGRLRRGESVEIKGINGTIHAVAASGNEVRVNATKSGKKNDPDEVKIEVLEHDDGVTICAVYPSSRRRSEPNECKAGSGGRNNVENNDVQVAFEVQVPAGVMLLARNVNGNINGDGLDSDVRAWTVNGGVTIDTNGLAEAHTVNGNIKVAMDRGDMDGELDFETVNGSIELDVGGDFSADIHATTVNGDIDTDFPLTVQGRFGPKRINGTIGRGGRSVGLSTVNGAIRIRKR